MKVTIPHFQKITSLLFAFVAILCTPYVLKDELVNFSLSNSLFSVFIFIAYFFLLQFAMKQQNKIMVLFASILGLTFSSFMVWGRNVYTTGSTQITQLKTWGMILAFLPIFSALVVLCFRYLPMLCADNNFTECKINDRKKFLVVWLLIFLAWIPVLLASYPGVYGYDSIYQINYYRSGDFSLHHPIAHSYMLGFFVVTLGNLFGSYKVGMCCYSVFQMLCMSAAYSALYSFYVSKRCKKWVCLVVLLLFMFLPTNAIMAMSATKDALFSVLIALGTMLLFMISENPGRLKSIKFDIALTAIFLLIAIFRNQGKYIIIATFIIAILFLWKYKKQLLIMLISFVVLLGIYNGPITVALNGTPVNSLKEMMSVPCMQLSRAGVLCQDQLTDEEILSIEEYIRYYAKYQDAAGISDLFKNYLNTDKIKENPMDFIRLWVKVGLKCPTAYVDAFARITIGYWYPDMNYRDPQAFHPYWEYSPTGSTGVGSFDEEKYILLKQTPVKGFEPLYNWLHDLTYKNTYQSVPLISLLFSSALPTWCLLIVLAYTLYKRRYRCLIPLGFLLMLLATLILGPVVLYRYVFPLYLIIPLLLCSGGGRYKIEKDEK